MFGSWKFLAVLVFAGFLASGSTHAMTVHSGVDGAGSTANSDAAFAGWQAAVSSFTLDDMTGLGCGGGPVVCTTSAGNTFTQGVGGLTDVSFNVGVVSGANLLMIQLDDPGSFTWDFAQPADAFGFFVHDSDGETVTIAFNDGSVREFTIATGLGTQDNLFWGITGLAGDISSVTLSAVDTPGYSIWDNVVFGDTTIVPATVPVPAALPLFLSALALFGFVARRRAHAATG